MMICNLNYITWSLMLLHRCGMWMKIDSGDFLQRNIAATSFMVRPWLYICLPIEIFMGAIELLRSLSFDTLSAKFLCLDGILMAILRVSR